MACKDLYSEEDYHTLRLMHYFKITHIVSKNRIYFNSSNFDSQSFLAFDLKSPKIFYIVKPKYFFNMEYFQTQNGETTIFRGHPLARIYLIKPSRKINLEKVKFVIETIEDMHPVSETFENEDFLHRRAPRRKPGRISHGFPPEDYEYFPSSAHEVLSSQLNFYESDVVPDSNEFPDELGASATYDAMDDIPDVDTFDIPDDTNSRSDDHNDMDSIDSTYDDSDIEPDINEEDIPFDFIYKDFLEMEFNWFLRFGRKLLKLDKRSF